MTENWPVADLDPVRRLRVLAAAVRFPVYVSEVVLPAPVERVWAAAADLERALPSFISTVRSARITRAEGDRLELLATGTLGQRARFDVVLRPGWCLMRSRSRGRNMFRMYCRPAACPGLRRATSHCPR